ncbi:DUF5591 domain-containing protein [Pyrolobus fumarii]|nr:DUF5591 domain-containing protein [Pyrolobus fumarii]
MVCPRRVWTGKELDWVEPGECREYIRGVGLDYLIHPAFEKGFSKLLTSYEPPRGKILLFLPCSYGKPYSQSFIHYMIRRTLWKNGLIDKVHEVMLTNAGVVPRELDEHWPYAAYDWNPIYETPEIRECYRRVLADRITAYLETFKSYYRGFAAYLRWDSDSWAALRVAAERLGIRIENFAARTVPNEEVREVSLGGLYQDADLVLVTRSSLASLVQGLKKLVKELGL